MELDGCHICRSTYPFDAMAIDLRSSGIQKEFRGVYRLLIKAAVKDSKLQYEENGFEPLPFTISSTEDAQINNTMVNCTLIKTFLTRLSRISCWMI